MIYRDIALIAHLVVAAALAFLAALSITMLLVGIPDQVSISGTATIAAVIALIASCVAAWADGKVDG